jgi:hypothetical protein
MNLYIFHSCLFSSPRIITTNIVASREALESLANHDNSYSDENRWKLQEIPYYPKPVWNFPDKHNP